MSAVHPYAELRALLDTTRQLTPEEMAELHLEQGFVDRALRIYDELAAREPANPSYATRREWLARMAAARPATPAKARAREEAPRDRTRTLMGIGPVRQADGPAMVRRLRIVGVR